MPSSTPWPLTSSPRSAALRCRWLPRGFAALGLPLLIQSRVRFGVRGVSRARRRREGLGSGGDGGVWLGAPARVNYVIDIYREA